jgi:hypothetical protein
MPRCLQMYRLGTIHLLSVECKCNKNLSIKKSGEHEIDGCFTRYPFRTYELII